MVATTTFEMRTIERGVIGPAMMLRIGSEFVEIAGTVIGYVFDVLFDDADSSRPFDSTVVCGGMHVVIIKTSIIVHFSITFNRHRCRSLQREDTRERGVHRFSATGDRRR